MGVAVVSFVPGMQQGPRSVGGIGIRLQVEPAGIVPSDTNVVWSGRSGSCVPLGNTMACLSCTKSSGCCWKQASVRSVKLSGVGQSRY